MAFQIRQGTTKSASNDDTTEMGDAQVVIVEADGTFDALQIFAMIGHPLMISDESPSGTIFKMYMPPAADLVAAIPGATVGKFFRFIITNMSIDAHVFSKNHADTGGSDDGFAMGSGALIDVTVQLTNVTAGSEAYNMTSNSS